MGSITQAPDVPVWVDEVKPPGIMASMQSTAHREDPMGDNEDRQLHICNVQ